MELQATVKKFPRTIGALDDIFEFLEQYCATHNLGSATAGTVCLAVEEIFTNMVKYNEATAPNIEIGVSLYEDRLEVRLVDAGVSEFDITHVPEVDTSQPLKNRRPGGLGLHLVKKIMDRVEYEYTDGTSKITMIKYLGN
ncbi:MAG: ATP-binding protein [candidate division Zixibacteria bacterium]|nr:ATP-binding protein [candidate division Zixibacteria bacterium]